MWYHRCRFDGTTTNSTAAAVSFIRVPPDHPAVPLARLPPEGLAVAKRVRCRFSFEKSSFKAQVSYIGHIGQNCRNGIAARSSVGRERVGLVVGLVARGRAPKEARG